LEGGARLPPEHLAGAARVADEQVDLGRPEEALVLDDIVAVVEADVGEGPLAEVAYGVRLAGGDDVVAGLVLLDHAPHGLDEVGRVPPVATRLEVAHPQLGVDAGHDPGHAPRDLAGGELGPA